MISLKEVLEQRKNAIYTGIERKEDKLGRITIPKIYVNKQYQRCDIFMIGENEQESEIAVVINEDGKYRFDELNRIVIPVEIRKKYGTKQYTPYRIIINKDATMFFIRPVSMIRSILEIEEKLKQICPGEDWGKWLRSGK